MYLLIPPAGEDYTNFPGPSPGVLTVVFPAGTRNGAVMNAPLTVLNDIIVEGTETVVLMGSIQPGVKASLAPGQDRVIIPIWDNDSKCSASPLAIPGYQGLHD